jgi:hypothetical protein
VAKVPWKLDAPANTVVCRRLSSSQGDLYVLFNESRGKPAPFTLDLGGVARAEELLFPDTPAWRQTSGRLIRGSLGPLQGAVVFCGRSGGK